MTEHKIKQLAEWIVEAAVEDYDFYDIMTIADDNNMSLTEDQMKQALLKAQDAEVII